MLDVNKARATIPPLTPPYPPYTHTPVHIAVYPSAVLPQHLHSAFRAFNNRVCIVMKATVGESNPDSELLTQQTFCFSLDVLARRRKNPQIIAMSMASDWGPVPSEHHSAISASQSYEHTDYTTHRTFRQMSLMNL